MFEFWASLETNFLRQHPTPNVTILGKNIFYDSKIDLTPIFLSKKKFKTFFFTRSYGRNSVFFTNCF